MRKLILFSLILLLFSGCSRKSNSYVYVTIPEGASLDRIIVILKKNKVITSETAFKIMAKLEHKDKDLKSGVYKLKEYSSAVKVINILSEGKSETVRITIPEGYTIKQIGSLLKNKFGITTSQFKNYTCDQTVLRKYGIRGTSFEGYLFPDTYLFNASVTLEEIIKRLSYRFNEVYAAESTKYWHILKRPRYKIIIMASIIQAEARYKSEMPIIASVYYNRLREGYRLDSDPTVMYAIGRHKDRLTYKDLKINSLYNTYKYYGLPPGPICNPGKSAIKAAMFPAHTNYLYFVADVNGHHIFARTLREHNRNIRTVRRHRRVLRK